MRRTPASLVLHALVIAGLVGGLTAFVAADKTVTLSVDGDEQTVRTFAGDVSALLAEEGVEVEPNDTVVPSGDTALEDGQTVAVRNGRLVSVTVDGEVSTFWTTAETVGEAVDVLGERVDSATLSASRSKRIPLDGIELEARTPKTVTVVADGRSQSIATTMPTVRQVLGQLEVTLDANDQASVTLDTVPTEGLSVVVTRVDAYRNRVQTAVPFTVTRRNDATLFTGTTKVVQPGKVGSAIHVYDVVRRNGQLLSARLHHIEPLVAPVAQIVAVGTKARPAPAPSPASSRSYPTSSGGLNWAALARCESGGNPRAVNSAGYYGLYQFNLGTWRSVGGSGNPIDASASEQTYRAQLLYNRRGTSPWPHCGRYL